MRFLVLKIYTNTVEITMIKLEIKEKELIKKWSVNTAQK